MLNVLRRTYSASPCYRLLAKKDTPQSSYDTQGTSPAFDGWRQRSYGRQRHNLRIFP